MECSETAPMTSILTFVPHLTELAPEAADCGHPEAFTVPRPASRTLANKSVVEQSVEFAYRTLVQPTVEPVAIYQRCRRFGYWFDSELESIQR